MGLEWALWIRDVTGLVNGRQGPGPLPGLVACVIEYGGIWLMIQRLSLNSQSFRVLPWCYLNPSEDEDERVGEAFHGKEN